MAIHWQVKFRSLRADTLYTVNIYDDSYTGSTPVQLTGAAQPFTTQEDDDDDIFTPIRTQSGYLRIVDTGYDNAGNAFNWRDFIPATDTDRPVTLTNEDGNTLWMGFIQAQNFGAQLYELPQEREYPLQCPLTVTSCRRVDYNDKYMRNFAYLLRKVVDAIPSVCRPETFVFQGTAPVEFLLKKIDWQNFVSVVDDETEELDTPSYLDVLTEMCRFWGWNVRLFAKTLYFTCVDETTRELRTISDTQLRSIANGYNYDIDPSAFGAIDLADDVYASEDNNDYQMRGPDMVSVVANGNKAGSLMDIYPFPVVKAMTDSGTYLIGSGGFGPAPDVVLRYTIDRLEFTSAFLSGVARSGYGSFNVMYARIGGAEAYNHSVVKLTQSYSTSTAQAYASLSTEYEHAFSEGVITLNGEVYVKGEIFHDYVERTGVGNKHMYIRVGIGFSRETALWYHGGGGFNPTSSAWSATMAAIKVTIGNQGPEIIKIKCPDKITGKLFIDFLGSDDMQEFSTDYGNARIFDVADINVVYELSNKYWVVTSTESGNFASLVDGEVLKDRREYISRTTSNVQNKKNISEIFASDNNMSFGYGVLLNPNDTFFTGYDYGGMGLLTFPEQHLADRITAYWTASKRKIECDLRTDKVSDILTPENIFTIEGTELYPCSISHNWRDDVSSVVFLEI